MQIDGEGISEGSKLLQLTEPLARAGVSILFITTYFADYVLVAAKEVAKVKQVLLDSAFAFEDLTQSFVSQTPGMLSSFGSPAISPTVRSRSTSLSAKDHSGGLGGADGDLLKSSFEARLPQASISTLDFLRRSQVPVTLFESLKLIMTGLRKPLSQYLKILTHVLLQPTLPRFFSLTVAPETLPSMLMEPSLAATFGGAERLMGADADQVLIPVTLDLRGLTTVGGGLGGCGIICGVVEELLTRVSRSRGDTDESAEALVMSYLSTVVTGNVLLLEEDLEHIGSNTECILM